MTSIKNGRLTSHEPEDINILVSVVIRPPEDTYMLVSVVVRPPEDKYRAYIAGHTTAV